MVPLETYVFSMKYENHISRRNSNIANAYQSASLRTKTIEIHQNKNKLPSDGASGCFICVFYQHTSMLYCSSTTKLNLLTRIKGSVCYFHFHFVIRQASGQ